jgi:DNA repair protein RadC
MRVYEAEISYKATLNEVDGRSLNEPEKVYEYLKDINELYPVQETFWVVFLTTRRHPIARLLVTIGTATASLAHPREVFKGAILAGAVSIIVAHNHPSGNTHPSEEDKMTTRHLCQVGHLLEIPVLDHIILSPCGYCSIKRDFPYLFDET